MGIEGGDVMAKHDRPPGTMMSGRQRAISATIVKI